MPEQIKARIQYFTSIYDICKEFFLATRDMIVL